MSHKFYAVKKGRIPGIYTDWETCKAQVDGYPGASYKSFKAKEEAVDWMCDVFFPEIIDQSETSEEKGIRPFVESDSAIAYVDGSYSEALGRFSYGVVFFTADEELHFSRSFSDPELIKMRNVAGEIMGSGCAMREALERGLVHLSIYHDYEGIAKWCTGEWKTNKDWTKSYKRFYNEVSEKVDIDFVKVKAHSKNKFNDLADELAKKALE